MASALQFCMLQLKSCYGLVVYIFLMFLLYGVPYANQLGVLKYICRNMLLGVLSSEVPLWSNGVSGPIELDREE